ncbi:ionotropic receptor 75a-like [Aricia agestis]|uniref:ionotropic receptor 75a-like n=1 Tax=Aricia agestis TaxID=91739 RepID=UPI001C20632D|nr:ionotropic receptor 75a-like [Aricia agestis]
MDEIIGEDFTKLDVCLAQRLAMGVLVNANCQAFEKVINYASENMMLDSKRKWLIISVNADKLSEAIVDDYNINHLVKINNETNINENDTECNNGTDVLCCNITEFLDDMVILNDTNNKRDSESGEHTKQNKSNAHVPGEIQKCEGKVFAILDKLNISVDADITYAETTDNDTYELFEIFNFGKIQGGSLLVTKIGSYSNGLSPSRDSSYAYYKRWDFNKLNMRIIVVMSPIPEVFDPAMILGRTRNARTAVVIQIGTQVIQTVAELHNIELVYTVVDRWVGDFQRNGTYTVTNALNFREADISPIIRFIPPFFGKLDFVSTVLSSIETKFYYRIPSSGPGNFENQFLTPLTAGAWWGVVGLCVVCGVVLLTSSLFEERPFSLPYSFFSVFALVCQQFFEDTDEKGIKRSSAARKITILITGMSCVLIYNYYTSSVVSWLLNGPPPSINSLAELINSPLQPIFEDIGYTRSWLQLPDYYYNKRNAEDEDKLKKKIFKQMKKMSIFRTVDEGIELVKQGGYAYHTETNAANDRISRTFDQREMCDMGSLQVMEKTMLFAAVQQHSPYKEFFNWSFMRLNERGIISCIRARMSSQESSCEGSSPRALALGGAAPAFILLLGGYVLGMLIMMMERWHYRYQGNQLQL